MSFGRVSLETFLSKQDCSGGPDSCGIEYHSPDRVRVNKPDNKLLGSEHLKVGALCRVSRKSYRNGLPYSLVIEFKKQPIGVILKLID